MATGGYRARAPLPLINLNITAGEPPLASTLPGSLNLPRLPAALLQPGLGVEPPSPHAQKYAALARTYQRGNEPLRLPAASPVRPPAVIARYVGRCGANGSATRIRWAASGTVRIG